MRETGRRLLVATSRAGKKPRLERWWSQPPNLSRKTVGGKEKAPKEHPSWLPPEEAGDDGAGEAGEERKDERQVNGRRRRHPRRHTPT